MIKFPEGFLWGAATSAYQVEGDNVNSDWWRWEIDAGKERSGRACRHYELYEEDFDAAKALHHNAHRLSIEWSRIEPEEGKFSEEALKHYIDVILSLKARNIEPIVTLHHFTNPQWFARSGGWENKKSVARYLRYCDFTVRSLAKHLRYWITINEPTIYVSHAYIFGVWPPQAKSCMRAWRIQKRLLRAHIEAFCLIHKIYTELKLSKPAVSISQYTQAFVPCTNSLKDGIAAAFRDKLYNFWFLDKIMRYKAMDFVGVNYYSRQLVEPKNWGIRSMAMDTCGNNHHPVKKNSLGWDIYPEGLFELLLKLNRYRLPVIITENGIATGDDKLRWEYICSHLENIRLAIAMGVNVTGYLYWSLLDNFEWDKGFTPRFGLVGIDYKTYKRTARESAQKFGEVCKTGILEC